MKMVIDWIEIFLEEEVDLALHQINSNKSLGHDVMTTKVLKYFWSISKPNVMSIVEDFLYSGKRFNMKFFLHYFGA